LFLKVLAPIDPYGLEIQHPIKGLVFQEQPEEAKNQKNRAWAEKNQEEQPGEAKNRQFPQAVRLRALKNQEQLPFIHSRVIQAQSPRITRIMSKKCIF
jgi:hypothetical protein